MLEQTVVNFVPTGMIPTKAMTPHVPVHADEIVASVRAAYELGISMVHLHAREPDSGRPTLAADIYAEIIAGIREFAPTLVICVSLSGRKCPDAEIRSAPLRLALLKVAHQHQLISGKPLQKHGHRRVHMHPVGDQPQSNAALTTGRTQGARRTVMQSGHGIETVGQHPDPKRIGRHRLLGVGGAMPQRHGDAKGAETLDDRLSSLELRGQGDQGDLMLEAFDPAFKGLQAGLAEMLKGMGASARLGQEGAFEMGSQKPAAVGVFLVPRRPKHR